MTETATAPISTALLQLPARWPHLMTFQQAARCYGYQYQTLRHYASVGRLRIKRDLRGRPWVSHQAMHDLLASRDSRGRTLEVRQRETFK